MFRFDRAELGDVILMVMSRHHGRVLYGFMPQKHSMGLVIGRCTYMWAIFYGEKCG